MKGTYTRIYADAAGETHFETLEVPLEPADFAPPSPLMLLSDAQLATTVRFLSAPPGWDSDPHPTPRRQFVIMLRGIVESETSDGEVRRFAPGQVVLAEDTTGCGHRTRIIGDEDWLAAVVTLD